MQLHWVDIGILVVIGLSVITGLFRGFVKELVACGIWVVALWMGYHYTEAVNPFLSPYIHDKTLRTALAFVLILLSVLLAGGIINVVLGLVMQKAGLSGTDRTLGMGFGFIRGVFLVALLMVAVKMTSLPYQQYAKNSLLYTQFDPVVSWLYAQMPTFIQHVKSIEVSEAIDIIDSVPINGIPKA